MECRQEDRGKEKGEARKNKSGSRLRKMRKKTEEKKKRKWSLKLETGVGLFNKSN
jgi:hypothetical protein